MDLLLFIINPISGAIDKTRIPETISDFCIKNKKDFKLFYTTKENDSQKIRRTIEERRPQKVIACGGDGTVNIVASALIGLDLPLGIIPMGSANGLSVTLGIPTDIRKSLDVCLNGRTRRIDTLHINNRIFCFHLSDLGFNAKMIKDFEESGERGMVAYAKSFFRSLATKSTSIYDIAVNGQNIQVSADMIVLANASKYGTGAVISPESRLDDGTFELIIFRPIPLSALLALTLESFLGDLRNSPYVEIYTTAQVEIRCNEPVFFQADGELIGEVTEILVEILKNTLMVLVPLNDRS